MTTLAAAPTTMQISPPRGLPAESRVDRKAKVIHGARVMSLGPLHPADERAMQVDEATVLAVAKAINDSELGVKGRFAHPAEPFRPGLGTYLGRWRNAVIDSLGVRADLHLADASAQTPHGDLGGYVLDLAEEDPAAFGASVHLLFDWEAMEAEVDAEGLYPIRFRMLRAIDIVDEPATAQGFFSVLGKDQSMAPTTPQPAVATTATAPTPPAQPAAQTPAEPTLSVATPAPPVTPATPAKPVEPTLSVADQLAAAKAEAAAAERKRAGEILALCTTAGHPEAADKYLSDATFSVDDVRKQLFEQLCKDRKTVGGDGDGDLSGKPKDPDAEFKREFAADRDTHARFGVSEEDYVRSRRRDQGLPVSPRAKAAG